MKRILGALIFLCLLSAPAFATRAKVQGYCADGSYTVTVPGGTAPSVAKYQRSFPGCTVTVYGAGGVVVSTIYSTATGTAKANPFTAATTNGSWFFYANGGNYDVRLSGAGIPTPFTLGDIRVPSETLNIADYGAKCDGSTDDITAINRAITAAPAGSTVVAPAVTGGSCRITQTLSVMKSNITLDWGGNEILYQPASPGTGNDRALQVNSVDPNSTTPIAITGATAIGATSFVAASTAGLVAGDWLFVQEIDPSTPQEPQIVIADYVQVLTIAGTTVNTVKPFRQAFPDLRNGTTFFKIPTLTQNVTVRNMRCRTTDTGNSLPCFFTGFAKGVTFDNVQASSANGLSFGSFRANGLTIKNSRAITVGNQGVEFAATTDLVVDGNQFIVNAAAPVTLGMVLDYGTAFFSVVNNQFASSANFGLAMWFGVYYGSVANNVISYVNVIGGPTSASGISGLGTQHISITGNTLTGGVGVASVGLALADTSGFTVDVPTLGNFVSGNTIANFTYPYNFSATGVAPNANDAYITANETNGYIRLPGKVQFGEAATQTGLISINSSTLADLPIRWTKIGTNNWFAGPKSTDASQWCVDFNALGANTLCVTQLGDLYPKRDIIARNIDGQALTANTFVSTPAIYSSGTTPAIEAGVGACTSPTVGIVGNNVAGAISVTSGTACAGLVNARIVLVTFSTAYSTTPRVIVTPTNFAAASLATPAWISGSAANILNFDLGTSNTALANSTAYTWNYLVVQ